MKSNIEIVPSVLATSEDEYKEKIEEISQSPELADGWVQIDLMDGKFVSNTSVGIEVLVKYPINLQKEVHLMVEDPLNWIDDLAKLGAKRIIVHGEADQAAAAVGKIIELGLEAGIALNPETPVAKIVPFIDTINLVLLMSVHPGFGGQEFIPETVKKVEEAVQLQSESKNKFLIEVDGGINESNATDLAEAGADVLVIGEHLINGDILENFTKLWEVIRPSV